MAASPVEVHVVIIDGSIAVDMYTMQAALTASPVEMRVIRVHYYRLHYPF